MIGVILTLIAIVLFALAPTYPLILLANALWAVGFTFDSGAALALLYDSLRQVGREAEYTRLRGRLAVVTHVSIATSGVLGGIVGALDLTLPFLLYAVLLLAALGLVWSLYEPPQATTARPRTSARYLATLRTRPSVSDSRRIRYMLLYSALMPLAISIVGVVFLQPHARALGLPIARWASWCWACMGCGRWQHRHTVWPADVAKPPGCASCRALSSWPCWAWDLYRRCGAWGSWPLSDWRLRR